MTTDQTLQALESQLLEDEAAAANLDGAADVCSAEQYALAMRLRDAATRIRRLTDQCRALALIGNRPGHSADFTRGQFVMRSPK